MSLKFYNPPIALLAKGTKEGVDIGGSLNILAMDQDLNLHNVKTIFSELSWGEFWEDPEINDQIKDITMKVEDIQALFDPKELVKRLIEAFAIIQARGWIFLGIADFESNSFQDGMLIEGLDYQFIERLMLEHKRIRDQSKFPELIDEQMMKVGNAFIYAKFYGKAANYLHYPPGISLFSIFNKLKPISGNIAGIVCTSQGAANFYILSENIHTIRSESQYRIDVESLEIAFDLMKKNIIFPISWFKINLGLASLKILEQWDQIKDNEALKKVLLKYFKYVNSSLKQQHEQIEKEKKQRDKLIELNIDELTEEERQFLARSLEEIINAEDLGLFKKKK
ncbi:MAG: hypothetical protein ACTSRZ_03610 [Promethearchaeota archaeon]